MGREGPAFRARSKQKPAEETEGVVEAPLDFHPPLTKMSKGQSERPEFC